LAVVDAKTLERSLGSKILYTRVTLMTFDFITTDEITGVVIGNPSYTNDATSDVRRTMSLELYPTDSTFDVARGGKVWMDKYVKVEIGIKKNYEDEIEYFNMGIYVIDNPTKTYSATENKLTLNCLDLMSRLTGIRGGVIESMEHVIPAGSNIRQTIIALLKEGRISKYVVEECTIDVPNDITVDGGSSIYDLLNELVQLLPNYQIYFDVDGVFHYELIPNGVAEPICIDDDIWKEVLISYDTAYDFENVKNCVEILGGAHDNPAWINTVNYARNPDFEDATESTIISNVRLFYESDDKDALLTLINGDYVVGQAWSDYNCNYICVEFPPLADFRGKVRISSFDIEDDVMFEFATIEMREPFEIDLSEDTSRYVYIDLELRNATTQYEMQHYFWTSSNYYGTYLGEYQPSAVLYETNPDSPFYDSIDYHCDCAYDENHTATIGSDTVDMIKLYIDEPYVSLSESLYTKVFQYSLSALSTAKESLSDLRTTSDSSSYGAGYCWCQYFFKDTGKYVQKYSGVIKAELLLMGTHIARYNQGGTYSSRLMPYTPASLGTLRIVLSGDEYDNIWSDDLAMQRAKFELYQRCRLLDTVTLTILPIYWLDVNWLVELTLPNETGTEETNQYLIKSISTDGGVSGTQTVTLMRYYPYYPSIN
jgi:hypothetical protein